MTANIRLRDASRSIASRAADDETILKDWLNDGAKLGSVYD